MALDKSNYKNPSGDYVVNKTLVDNVIDAVNTNATNISLLASRKQHRTINANTLTWFTLPERTIMRLTFHTNSDNQALDLICARTTSGNVVITEIHKGSLFTVTKGESGVTVGITCTAFIQGTVEMSTQP